MEHRRTDLAAEAREIWREAERRQGDPDGVVSEEYETEGLPVHAVEIRTEEGARALGKPVGRYVTIDIDALISKEEDAFARVTAAISAELRAMLLPVEGGEVMVAGLGNREITPDAVGPHTAEKIIATRHLLERMPDQFGALRSVTVVSPGVLGTTGIETGEILLGIKDKIKPGLMLVVDALASRSSRRLCRTVQLANTGVVPGSGVGNSRFALNFETLGIPCVAVGVPTVVDAATLAADIIEESGGTADFALLREKHGDTFVTLKEIDLHIADCSKAIAYGVNLALQESLSLGDVELFLS